MIIKIVTDHLIAVDAWDTIEPKGTVSDNLHCMDWAKKMVEKFGLNMAYCDLGTAGGGLVKDFVDLGVELAVGIDGSAASKVQGRAEWGTIPENLFTADITKPFEIWAEPDTWPEDGPGNFARVKFDLISSYDVMEHIPEERFNDVLKNIYNNLKVGGYTMHSIADFPDEGYHVCLQSKEWWIDKFESCGMVYEEIIGENEYPRGGSSFYLTFRKK